MTGVCTERVAGGRGWTSKPCGRAIKDEGLCGLHLAAKRRREEKSRQRVEESERAKELKKEADALSVALGVNVAPDYSWVSSSYTGDFIVPADWLRDVARKMRTER